jgi:hypothetical protein
MAKQIDGVRGVDIHPERASDEGLIECEVSECEVVECASPPPTFPDFWSLLNEFRALEERVRRIEGGC